jgi:hypothetical protein
VSDVYAIVREIRENRLPRNRNFDVHAQPIGEEARRLHRFLRGVERDLAAATHIEVVRGEAGYTVSLTFPSVRLTRVVSLSQEEYALLVEDPTNAARLAPR